MNGLTISLIVKKKQDVEQLKIDYDTYADGEALFGWLNGIYSVAKEENFNELAAAFFN